MPFQLLSHDRRILLQSLIKKRNTSTLINRNRKMLIIYNLLLLKFLKNLPRQFLQLLLFNFLIIILQAPNKNLAFKLQIRLKNQNIDPLAFLYHINTHLLLIPIKLDPSRNLHYAILIIVVYTGHLMVIIIIQIYRPQLNSLPNIQRLSFP